MNDDTLEQDQWYELQSNQELRLIELYSEETQTYKQVRMQDLRVNDKFRMFDGAEPVIFENTTIFTVSEAPTIMLGVWGVVIKSI